MANPLALPSPSDDPPNGDIRQQLAATLGRRASEIEPVLPVTPPLAEVLPERGLRRGATVSVTASTALLITLVATASANGAWCAVAGLPTLGLLACAEAGVALERLLLVPDITSDWSRATATLLEGCDITVVAPPSKVTEATSRKLAARARAHKSVLIGYGTDWPGADVVLSPTTSVWHGIGRGHGRLRHRELGVTATGRRTAGRPRHTTLHLGLPETPSVTPPRLRTVS
ncbi:hypothetical protein [Stackebrandtia nassauensis]|uniref:Uncharacterized protein n=1 Tax=Stackebrandtia nassauensis (strain DSM 44728 / CIP 108903 / NRRL B-16338 / NBRC 102104 / LLR-40K-21) TaxID=446470 RepID=D3Q9D9_STANL|nr:hypothetical protein [Stackebrandtia nassauensis]ADD42621.1 hypothetical protein Snas_2946 [Stackebrandtia nassauensis DSM 44728]